MSYSNWDDIVAVSTNAYCTLVLKLDSTVVAVRDNNYGKCVVSDWNDIKLPNLK